MIFFEKLVIEIAALSFLCIVLMYLYIVHIKLGVRFSKYIYTRTY